MWAKKKITNNPHNQNFLLGKNFHLRTLQKTYNYSQPNKFDETPWRGQPQFSIVLLCCTCFRETTYIDQRIFFSICRIASMKTRTGNGKTWSKQWKLAKCKYMYLLYLFYWRSWNQCAPMDTHQAFWWNFHCPLQNNKLISSNCVFRAIVKPNAFFSTPKVVLNCLNMRKQKDVVIYRFESLTDLCLILTNKNWKKLNGNKKKLCCKNELTMDRGINHHRVFVSCKFLCCSVVN